MTSVNLQSGYLFSTPTYPALTYTGYQFKQISVYTDYQFIQGSVNTGYQFIQASFYAFLTQYNLHL